MDTTDAAVGDGSEPIRPEQRQYLDDLRSRVRTGRLGALLRTLAIQGLWVLVVLAGAGVPLNQAVGGPGWVGPTLGFIVVVAAGIERVFARTTPAAAAQDVLRRGLAREHRLYLAGAGSYSGSDAFARFAERCEQLIADYDRIMVSYSTTLASQAE